MVACRYMKYIAFVIYLTFFFNVRYYYNYFCVLLGRVYSNNIMFKILFRYNTLMVFSLKNVCIAGYLFDLRFYFKHS